jgi:hypothetical protein
MVLTPQQLARQVGGSVKCDSGSTVAGATRLIAGANGTTPDGGVCFPSEFFITVGAFTLGQVRNFWSLAYVADYYGELRPLEGAALAGNEPPMSPPPPCLLGADLEVHHQITTGEVLPPPDSFWHYLPDLPFEI